MKPAPPEPKNPIPSTPRTTPTISDSPDAQETIIWHLGARFFTNTSGGRAQGRRLAARVPRPPHSVSHRPPARFSLVRESPSTRGPFAGRPKSPPPPSPPTRTSAP